MKLNFCPFEEVQLTVDNQTFPIFHSKRRQGGVEKFKEDKQHLDLEEERLHKCQKRKMSLTWKIISKASSCFWA